VDSRNSDQQNRTRSLTSTISLTIAIGAALPVQAELTSIDDNAMAEVTGQSGITIDMRLKLNVAEVAYRDGGYLSIEDFAWGGADRTGNTAVAGAFENWRMVLDVADTSEPLAYGFSELDQHHNSVASPDSDWDTAILANDDRQVYGDGDLVIHNTSTQLFDGTRYDASSDSDVALSSGLSAFPSNSFNDAMDDWRNSAPFGIKIGAVKLRDSGYAVGSRSGNGTTLLSNFNAEVLTGPLDIVIQNNGDGITNGVADSKIMVSDYFEISDLSVDLNIVGLSISGLTLHNRRGNTTGLNTNNGLDGIAGTADDVATESFGFAHAKWSLGKAAPANDGIHSSIDNVSVGGIHLAGAIKGDMDIDRISIGGNLLGSLHITDMTIESSMIIRSH